MVGVLDALSYVWWLDNSKVFAQKNAHVNDWNKNHDPKKNTTTCIQSRLFGVLISTCCKHKKVNGDDYNVNLKIETKARHNMAIDDK